MPVIEVLFSDLQNLVGTTLPSNLEQLNDLLSYAKGEVESLEGNALSIEIKDGNRPDLWSVEGVARTLRGILGIEEGLKRYQVQEFSGVYIDVHASLQDIRPYIASSIVKNVHMTDDIIREFMHLQDKLDQTYGRKRRRASIGLYNSNMITPPLQYSVAKPEEIRYIPLGEEVEMDLRTIITTHPKGIEYGHIIQHHQHWPILLDSQAKVLSMPPIINSHDLGRITEGVNDIFVEVTGTAYQTVVNTLNTITLSLADRGESILSTRIRYPYGEHTMAITPTFTPKTLNLELSAINTLLGLDLTDSQVIGLLKKARFNAVQDTNAIKVTIPCYRTDILHPWDVIEDIAIMYGYNNFKPRWPQQITFGQISTLETFSDQTREIMIGLGFQEIISYILTNKQKLFEQMNHEDANLVELFNPTGTRFTCIRSWLMPSLMEVLSHNTHIEYPQKIFEAGDCATKDPTQKTGVKTPHKLACLIAHSHSNFSEIQSVLEAFFLNLGLHCELIEISHDSFIDGRVGTICVNHHEVGIIGEIHPLVLELWGVEIPVTGFEVNLSSIQHLIPD